MPNGGTQGSCPESADAPDAEAQAVTDRSRPERFSAAPLLAVNLLLSIGGNVRTLFDFLQEATERRLEADGMGNGDDKPHAGRNCEQNEHGLPDIGLEVEGFVKRAAAECSKKGEEQGSGRDPSSPGFDAGQVLAEAEFEPVFGDDDYVLCKVKVNARLLDVIRREGLGELCFGRRGQLVHCALLSGGFSGGSPTATPLNNPSAPKA